MLMIHFVHLIKYLSNNNCLSRQYWVVQISIFIILFRNYVVLILNYLNVCIDYLIINIKININLVIQAALAQNYIRKIKHVRKFIQNVFFFFILDKLIKSNFKHVFIIFFFISFILSNFKKILIFFFFYTYINILYVCIENSLWKKIYIYII